MIRVKRYAVADREQWSAFLASSKNGLFMFERDYMEYHSARFEDHSLLFLEDGELLALFPASRDGSELLSHGGLTFGGFISGRGMTVAKMLDCFDALREHIGESGVDSLLYKAVPYIYHMSPAEEDRYALFRQCATLVKVEPSCAVDLREPASLSRGRKGKISRAKREGVTVEESQDIGSFMDLVNEVLAKYHQTAAVHTAEEMKLLCSRFPDAIRLFAAMREGVMIAGTLLFVYPHVVHTQYLAANDVSREIGAMDYLICETMERFRNAKRYFDFGISTEQGGMCLNEGLMTQKERFGGRAIVHETFRLGFAGGQRCAGDSLL